MGLGLVARLMNQRDVVHSLERLVAEIDAVYAEYEAKARANRGDAGSELQTIYDAGSVALGEIRGSAQMVAARRVLDRAEIER